MVYQVQFPSSFLFCLLLFSCTSREEAIEVPAQYVQVADVALKHLNGKLLYKGKAFSGCTYILYSNSDTAELTPYYNGMEEGIKRTWYPAHKLNEERYYVAGKKESVHIGKWPDGSNRFEYHFKDDEHNGTAKEWYTNGQLMRTFHYANGKEEGLQQMWWPDGKVRANYVAKNGEQYGLIGRKLCKNMDYEKSY
jgi:antitoxin component YwqK of YwqJK toxin-antitoxin module